MLGTQMSKPEAKAKAAPIIADGGMAANVPVTVNTATAHDGKPVYLEAKQTEDEEESIESAVSALEARVHPSAGTTASTRTDFERSADAALRHNASADAARLEDKVLNCCCCCSNGSGYICLMLCNGKAYRCVRLSAVAAMCAAAIGCMAAFGIASQWNG